MFEESCMKRFVVVVVMALTCYSISAQVYEENLSVVVPKKSMFSIDIGYATDGQAGHGYGAFIKSSSFFGDSPVYYGFGSMFGDFITIKENFFETGLLIGYNDVIGETGLDYDLFLDFLITGGRINQETSSFRAEAPALHAGLSIGFPADSSIDGALSVASVIRPYNALTGEWEFSRSYFYLGLSLRTKSYMEAKELPWIH